MGFIYNHFKLPQKPHLGEKVYPLYLRLNSIGYTYLL